MIDYQYVSFDLKVDDSNKFVLRITAVMNKKGISKKDIILKIVTVI